MATELQAGTEHVDVLIVGAGLSGVGAGSYLERECPWASYTVLESRDAIGGTWDLFKYPGIRSDSDMYTLGYTFRPWDGEKAIADGADILQYIKDTAKLEGVEEHIRYRHKVVSVDWSSAEARWHVTAERTDTGETVSLTAGFVFSCTGYYRYDEGYLPDFAGMDRFSGTIIHPQHWPADFDFGGKQVVVIGSGATAVTLIPSLAQQAGHVTMLQRSPSYIASMPAKNPLPRLLKKVLPGQRGAAVTRWFFALMTQAFYQISQRQPKIVKRVLVKSMAAQLPKGYDVATNFTPHYNPWDQRVCMVPDGDLFKAIKAGKASVITDTIETFTERGVLLTSGAELEADVIVTATGLQLLFMGGVTMAVDGELVDQSSRMTYKGMMLEGVPNLAFAIGYTNASWTLKCDLTCDYVCRLLNHMHETHTRQCTAVNTNGTPVTESLLGLQSGYIQRGAHLLPKQGEAYPWHVYQSYVRDYRALKMRGITDSFMQFTNPSDAKAEAVAIAS
jgi:cation diffusion facilitator CzcD-associated flavoprotein CzcO